METEQPHPLDAVMADRGLSLADVAQLYRSTVARHGLRSGVDRNLVWKWKTGRRKPTVESQQYLADVFGVSRDVLANDEWPHWLRHALSSPLHVLQPPWSISGTLRVLEEITGGMLDRREFLVITGSTLSGLGEYWRSSFSDQVTQITVPSNAGRLTSEILDRIANRLAELRHLDDALGGGRDLCQLVDAEFRWLSRLAKEFDPCSTGSRLFSLVAEAARLCGWCCFDANYQAAGQAYYVAALRASGSAGDPMTGAHVLACMSFQAALTGHCQEAVSLIDSAQERLGHNGTPRLNALLASRKARAYAISGDAIACGRALIDAEKHLEGVHEDLFEPDWIYYFDEAELAAQAGACWIDLRTPSKAREFADKALGAIDPCYVRDCAIYHVRGAQANFQNHDLDLACQELGAAVDLAQQIDSARTVDTIQEARKGMSRYERDGRVRELDQRLTILTAHGNRT